jgi:hypothetical protein
MIIPATLGAGKNSNQPLIAPNSCNKLHSQQGRSSPGETLLPHGDLFSLFFFLFLILPPSGDKAPTSMKVLTS